MNKAEKQALENLDVLLTATQQQEQLPLARRIAKGLNQSVKLWPGNKGPARLKEANEEFDRHPLGTGITDPKYLVCECDNQKIDGKFCLSCGRKVIRKK